MNKNVTIEERIERLVNVYKNIDSIIEKALEVFPKNSLEDNKKREYINKIKNVVINDKEFNKIINQFECSRPPRIFILGRTGVGKSSLINALIGSYTAFVSNVDIGTRYVDKYECKDSTGRVLMEIMDSRGISEHTGGAETEKEAETEILLQIERFNPDVALMITECCDRSDALDHDINFVQNVCQMFKKKYKTDIPIVAVLNKADEAYPSHEKNPNTYGKEKLKTISDLYDFQKNRIQNKIRVNDIVIVSSYICWMKQNGNEVSDEEIKKLTDKELESLEIKFDGRYNIEALRKILEQSIVDYEAKMGIRMACRLEDVVANICHSINKRMAALSAAVSLSPIPVSDIFILCAIEIVDVFIIAALSGEEINIDGAKNFMFSVGAVGVFGKILQQAAKLANVFFPGVGSVTSSGIASGGTLLMGEAAISYYVRGKSKKNVRKEYKIKQDESK